MSNSFEDFVNNNLGIRMPLIEDNGHPHSSSKAAGILGSKYLDLNNNYLYEKTGEDNSSDWVKIASLGERRDVARGPNFSIQFNSGDVLAGNQYLTFLNNELSGVSGFFDELKVETIIADSMEVTGDLAVGGNLYVSGETFIQSVTDVSVTGDISGYRLEGTSGVFDITTGASGIFDLTSGSSGDFDNLFVSGVSEITSGQFSKQLTISGMTVLTGIDDIRTKAGGPDYAIQYGSGTGFYGSSNLIYSGEQLSGASGFFDDFKVTGDLAVGGNLYVSGETFIQSVTDVSVTGDISGYRLEGTSGVFDITTGVSGIFDLTSGSSGDFDNLFVSGVSEITSGQFSEQLTISGMTVLTGVETGHFITTGETGIFVTTGQTGDFVTTGLTGDFVTTGLTGDFVTTGETGIFVTTGQTGDFVTTGLTGDFVTTGETGIFVTTGQTGDFVTTGLTGDFVTTGETGIFVTTGQTGDFVTTGLTGDFVTTGETGIFVTTGQTGDFVTTGLTGDFVTTGETGIFVTTGQTGDFVTTGLTGDFVTTGETGSFINTGTVVEYIAELKGSNSYSELEYNASGDVTGLFTWPNDSQDYLVKTKKLTYNQSGLLTGVILTEGLLDVKLITELTYDSSGNLESIKKDYA
jgi:cytoskeletal protein CcmA (bactofilin family)